MNPDEIRRLLSTLFPLTNNITLGGDLPGERLLREGEGEGGAGGGGTPPAKAFTQDEVNGFVAKELAKERKKFADYDTVKAEAAKVSELSKQLEEMKSQLELAGKSEAEKTKLLAEKMEKQKALELGLAQKQAEEAKAGQQAAIDALRETKIRYGLNGVLTAAKALPEMMSYAVDAFRREAKIEFDEKTDKFSTIEVDGVPYADPKKAAEAWLKARPGFAAAPEGGSGLRNPNGLNTGGRSFDQMSPTDLAEIGLTNALAKR